MSPTPDPKKPASLLGPVVLIGAIVAGAGGAFAYTAGWLSPDRLTPDRFLTALAPPSGPAAGHRRNHAKGVCFTGEFVSNGAGARLSKAQALAAGRYPVVGRLNLATPNPMAMDASARVRGLSLQISTPDGQQWRMANITAPVFAASTPASFYELLKASGSKDPEALKAYAGAHPEFAGFGAWAGSAPWTESYAQDRYNGLNAFLFSDASGASRAVRWSFLPTVEPVASKPDELGKRGPNFLESELTDRVKAGPVRWKMVVTLAGPGDPTADPTKAWPEDREKVEVGEVVASAVQNEPDGPCRDLNFDPTVLPSGISTSDDPFPAARSAVYQASFDKRTAEAKAYPATNPEMSK
ncbi:catalase family peroxidase [Chenggangzhangella methanolivorans]|uniref:Catalase-related peroxidase n=1 Tax=Chenggangzhangella methanolivorans TaxID=1437009 RepID=A0A9E6UJD8_9HYPH|nr:catalase family peroxidase [Chenggangzhangella methanolivorans]QZO01848.1 catalase family peroxidase [Chenggangzhangella methanolivorans]